MIRAERLAVLLAFALVGTWSGATLADCVHDGKTYAEGTRIGVFVCEGGRWVERP